MNGITDTIQGTPLNIPLTVRPDNKSVITSGKAGKILPIAYVPLLREDRARGRLRVNVAMEETEEMLMNAVKLHVRADFIPFLAFDRFDGMTQFNRSYKGEPDTEGGVVTPFFERANAVPFFADPSSICNTLGLHVNELINTAPVEAYNVLVNHRRKARSRNLPLRDRLDPSLARAFWTHGGMQHIVPDFDEVRMDGQIPISVAGGSKLPVKGLRRTSLLTFDSVSYDENGVSGNDERSANMAGTVSDIDSDMLDVFVELESSQGSLSLADIQLARETQAFAKMREKYDGIDEDHIIDLLMSGIRVPEEEMSQPMLLDRRSNIFGMNRRYATDGDNLEKSRTNGESWVDISIATPPMNTGGIVLVTAEIVPEQMFERRKDYFLDLASTDDLPDAIPDRLDPQKVSIVRNDHVDVSHTEPNGLFGYAPLNHEWSRDLINVGGKYRRELGDPFDQDRASFWAIETLDPKLTEDFYLVGDINHTVFSDPISDPFVIQAQGQLRIVGLTQFGKGLQEAVDDYEKIMDTVDKQRIKGPAETAGSVDAEGGNEGGGASGSGES